MAIVNDKLKQVLAEGAKNSRISYLDHSDYGFSLDQVVELNPTPNYEPPILLSADRRKELDRLFQLKEANLIDLLETVTRIVNDSIRYGVPPGANGAMDAETGEYIFNTTARIVKRFRDVYKPTGTETSVGNCGISGDAIRKILRALQPRGVSLRHESCNVIDDPDTKIPAQYTELHDCTVVSDGKHYIVLNSKSPNPEKLFYVASKEQLKYLGTPFIPADEYKRMVMASVKPEDWVEWKELKRKKEARHQEFVGTVALD